MFYESRVTTLKKSCVLSLPHSRSRAKSHASRESVIEARENRNVFTYLSYWTLLAELNKILGFFISYKIDGNYLII